MCLLFIVILDSINLTKYMLQIFEMLVYYEDYPLVLKFEISLKLIIHTVLVVIGFGIKYSYLVNKVEQFWCCKI